MRDRQKIGSFFTDTATVLVGDPCKVIQDDGRRISWEEYLDLLLAAPDGPVHIRDSRGQTGAIAVPTGADGWYPVFLEPGDGEDDFGRIVIELGGHVEP
jgi:hypothetical protein